MLILFVPETRWIRNKEELAGKQIYPLAPCSTRTLIDTEGYDPRSRSTDVGILNVPLEWIPARNSVWYTIRTTLFPNVLWVIVWSSIIVSVQGAAGQVASAVLIAAGWQFETLGFAVIPLVIASPFVWLYGGFVVDKVSNWHAKRNNGQREPEAHLLSLLIPMLAGISGPLLFGYASENIETVPTWIVLLAIFLLVFALFTSNTLLSVYLVESYPQFAGPVLVNVSSAKLIVGFITSFDVTTWIQNAGFVATFGYYSLFMVATSLFLPLIYIYGKKIRACTSGTLDIDEPKDDKILQNDEWALSYKYHPTAVGSKEVENAKAPRRSIFSSIRASRVGVAL